MSSEALRQFKNACFESMAWASAGKPEKAKHWFDLAQVELEKLSHEKDPAANRV